MAEENKTEEENVTSEETTKEESTTEENSTNKEDTPKEDDKKSEEKKDEESEEKDDGKQKKKISTVGKILIGVIALLLLVLIIGIVLYLTGFFDPKEEPKQTMKQASAKTKMIQEEQDDYKFSIKDINSKKLNRQLAALTKENMKIQQEEELEKLDNEKKILEEQKKKQEQELLDEQNKLAEEKKNLEEKKALLEQQKLELEELKQQALVQKEELENLKKDLEKQEEKEKVSQTSDSNEEMNKEETKEEMAETKMEESPFLYMINIAKIKGELYKHYLDEVTTINPNVKLCRDDRNRIELYFGPFETSEQRKELFAKLNNNDMFKESYEVELSKEEFNKRCNY